jgi:hypothetical protein|nr:MAG TPA: hypothetical protein [Caudoviricetes sp.]
MAPVEDIRASDNREQTKPKTIFDLLEFKDKGIVHYKDRLDKVPQAFVNRFSIDFDDNKRYYSFNISTIVGSYEVTTTNPEVAKYLSNCFIDNEPADLSIGF